MTTTDAAELPVPDEAVDALRRAVDHGKVYNDDDVRPIVLPVVAAVLRELADQTKDRREVTGAASYRDGYFDGANSIRDLLIDYADQIAPEGTP